MWVVISADADQHNRHADMLPLCCHAWRRFMPEVKICAVLIGTRSEDAYSAEFGYWVNKLYVLRPSDKYSLSVVSRTCRLWYGAQLSGPVTFEDVDLILLQRDWHKSKLDQWKPGRIMRMGAEYYAPIIHESGKAPMSKFTCEAEMLAEIVNPNGLGFHEWIAQFDGVNTIDLHGRENVSSPKFSDESLLRGLMHKWGRWDLVDDVVRDWGNDDMYICDRARWQNVDWDMVRRGEKYEAHILKPYYENLVTVSESVARSLNCSPTLPGLKPLIEYLEFDEPALRSA